ncbi:ASPIC and UnbV [Rubripirellula tenax]|uniref:ASPIC and UnbV n=1 Tax=Rubripirellula tenax TaxID=2528015 RepID=A0A5C6EFT9_9BACT|nr:FG-GAP-like repeat-containing protein [Rubripirellula tenax]TWU47648.1 ASPIC and UnbV [Rubripirellula tenax]
MKKAAEASVSDDPLGQLHRAVSQRKWQEAWQLSSAVLTQHPDDAEVIQLVASAAQNVGKLDVAADLMIDACRAESLGNPARLNQATDALLKVGRLYDCMDLLEESLESDPMQHSIRQTFYDLCWGSENRRRAIPHGRFLVQHRRFDLRLLLSLSYTESGTDRLDSFIEFAKRHPSDKRPLVAEAKLHFDQGKFGQAATVLRSVLKLHPEHLPAIELQCRVLVASEGDGEFLALVVDAPDSIREYTGYWLAVGDWCWSRQQDRQAVRAYWEAARRDAGGREAWAKLATSLEQIPQDDHGLDQTIIEAIQDRVALLTRFSDAKSQFRHSPSQSNTIEMSKAAQSLGRLWEAEAWASIATKLPPDKTISVKQVRDSIVATMNAGTPWQSEAGHPELGMDLTNLALPELELDPLKSSKQSNVAIRRASEPGRIRLVNEAGERSLNFFGRTADDLDRPGIKIFKTLGCGGGAIDFDLDGWSDLYLAAAGGTPPHRDSNSNSLWRNQNGSFVDVTRGSETNETGFGQGIAVGDVNEDGFLDLLALNYGANTLFINNGDGTFTNATELMEQADRKLDWSSSGAIADLDQDGLADVVVLSYGDGLEQVSKTCGDGGRSRACGPLNFSASPDRFLHNTGTGNLVDRTEAWGLPESPGRGLGVTIGAFDHDPGVDVFVANDQSPNHYWSWPENTELPFGESAVVRGLGSNHGSPYQGSMGIATGDFDRDGDFDFYVTNFDKECNTYHEQVNDGVWRDQTMAQKLYSPSLTMVGFGTEAVDLDNDGVLELVVSNGHVDAAYPEDDSAPHAQPMQVFQRNSLGEFESIEQAIGGDYLSANHVGRALWTLDINRDGLTDFAVTHQTEPVALLVNRTEKPGNWIGLQLVGRQSSRDAIGSVVEVHSSDQRWIAALTSGDGYMCSNERILRVGLGDLIGECEVTVTWPDGQRQTYSHLKPNTDWLLIEGDQNAFDTRN